MVGVPIDSDVEAVSGVEACSVANRSGVGVDAVGRLHPVIRRTRIIGAVIQSLFNVHLNGFNIELLAGQDLCAKTPTIGAMDDAVFGTIFFKT